jgi:serine phosphatase RsbU (regulator of sigma subunit)
MKGIKAVIIFSVLNIHLYFGQNHTLASLRIKQDSLQQVLKTAKQDTNKVKILNNLSLILLNVNSLDTALVYGQTALALGEKIKFKRGVAFSHNNIGLIYERQGNHSAAMGAHLASLKIKQEVGDKQGLSISHNNIGNIYLTRGSYPDALKEYFASLKTAEEAGDKQAASNSHKNIGNVYYFQGNYQDARKEYLISLKLCEEVNDKKGIAACYNNIGNVYERTGNYTEALKQNTASLKISEEINDARGISNSHNNIGRIYESQGKYEEALKEHFASLKISEGIKNKIGTATSECNLGFLYTYMGKPKEAKAHLKKALGVSKEMGDLEMIKENYEGLMFADSMLNNCKGTLENYIMFEKYNDSLLNKENTKKTVQIQMQYEFDKKEALMKQEQARQAAVAEEERKRQRLLLWFIAAVATAVASIAILIFRSLRLARKQQKIIEMARDEISEQKKLVEEKNKDITDSITYAQRIQRAILANEEDILRSLPNSFLLYKPKDIVAGDFYFFETNDDVIFYAACDCTGHGVPGAMVSVVCSNALNRTVNEFRITEPGKILDKTRELVIETFERSEGNVKDGMDVSFCTIDLKKNHLQWAGANNPLWICRAGEIIELKADKQPIGKYADNKPFTTHSIELLKEDSIYMFTDGFADQFGGESGKKFKAANFKKQLLSIQYESMEKQRRVIEKVFEEWKGNLEQVDDVCVIGVKV